MSLFLYSGKRILQLCPEDIGTAIGRVSETGDRKARFRKGSFALLADGEEGEGTGEGKELLRVRQADGEFLVRGSTVREEVSFFIGMEGENIPEKKFLRRKAGIQARFPHHRVRGFVESLFPLGGFRDERAVRAAGPFSRTTENHIRSDHRMAVQQHALAGHGDAGELPSLIAAGFCYEKDFCLSQTEGQVVGKVLPPDSSRPFYVIVKIGVVPRIEGVFSMESNEMVHKGRNGHGGNPPGGYKGLSQFQFVELLGRCLRIESFVRGLLAASSWLLGKLASLRHE